MLSIHPVDKYCSVENCGLKADKWLPTNEIMLISNPPIRKYTRRWLCYGHYLKEHDYHMGVIHEDVKDEYRDDKGQRFEIDRLEDDD